MRRMANPVEITIKLDLKTLKAAGSALVDGLVNMGVRITLDQGMQIVGSVLKAIGKTKGKKDEAKKKE